MSPAVFERGVEYVGFVEDANGTKWTLFEPVDSSNNGACRVNFSNVLKRFVDSELAKEGITLKLLEMIDLSIAYSPVIPFSGGGVDDAIEVRPWGFVSNDELPEKFEVQHPLVRNPISRDGLKVMRARYLLARDAYYGPILDRFFHGPIDNNS